MDSDTVAGAGESDFPARAGIATRAVAGPAAIGDRDAAAAAGFGTSVRGGAPARVAGLAIAGIGPVAAGGSTITRAGDFSDDNAGGAFAGFFGGAFGWTLCVCSAPSRIAAATDGLGSRDIVPPAAAGCFNGAECASAAGAFWLAGFRS